MPKFNNSSVVKQAQMYDLIKVALGEEPADLAIINGDVVSVHTGELLSGATVLIKGNNIAYVGKNGTHQINSSTEVIDASGKVLIPGLIDGHIHADTTFSITEFLKYAMLSGTTTIVSETGSIALPLGYQGIVQFLKSVRGQPVKVFLTIPPMVAISRASEENAISSIELRRLLKNRECIGLGETYWAPVIANSPRLGKLIVETNNAGKRLEGHSSGAKNNKLQAYVAAGISSCHEPITAEEVKERLRLGLFVMIRESHIRNELEAIASIKDENIDLSWLALVSDGVAPAQLVQNGYMNFIVQKAINRGFDPIIAIKMATINVARYFHLEHIIGGIVPGRNADIVIIPDLYTIEPEYVISCGRVVARDGHLLIEPKRHSYPRSAVKSTRLPRDFTANDFCVTANNDVPEVKVRVIDQITGLVTREAIVNMPVSNGMLHIDTSSDLLKVAVIERTYTSGKTFVGFIRGFRILHGAFASSCAWDISGIVVVGADESDMAQAVNRIKQLKGGVVVCAGGKILAECPMPVGGLISTQPMETLAGEFRSVQQAAAALGFPYSDVWSTLNVLTSPAIAFFRISEDGLFDINKNCFVDLIV